MINGMDRSQVIQTLNDAWLVYEAQKNGTVQADTPLLRMESAAAKVLKDCDTPHGLKPNGFLAHTRTGDRKSL